MADPLKSFEVPEDEAAETLGRPRSKPRRQPSGPKPDLPPPIEGLHSFEVPEYLLERPPRMPGRKSPYKPYESPAEWLIPVSEMTEEMWARWERPADDGFLPSVRRKAALILWRRDGNICQVCGLKVDIRLRSPHPGSASIDHLEAMGWGSGLKKDRHVWGNVQLTHLHCNSMHQNFDQELVAVADYRHELQRAIQAVDAGRRAPMAPWQGHVALRIVAGLGPTLEDPWESPAWRREQERGRPRAPFGQEWPVL